MTDLGDFEEFESAETDGDRGTTDSPPDMDSTDARDDEFESVEATPAGSDRGLGTLSAADGLSVGETEEDTRLRAYVTVGNRSLVRVGAYAVADYPDGEALFCKVTALEYAQEFRSDDATEIHARRAMRSEGIDEAEVKTGLKVPGDGVFVGHLAVGGEKIRTAGDPPTVDYRLKDDYDDGDPLVFRHTLVAGGTGSGKTHASKNILRQYLGRSYEMDDGRTPGAAVVQFDPQDEYAQMHDDGDYPKEFGRRLDREGVKHGGEEDTKAFVPAVEGATYAADHHGAEQVAFTLPFSLVRTRPWLVAGAGLNDNQYQGLRLLLDRFFQQYGHGGTYAEFRTFVDDPALREELDEAGVVHEATFDAIKRKTRGFDAVFDGDAPPITDLVHDFVRPGGLTTVPTYHINDSRQTTTVVLAVASLLVDEKLSNDPRFDRIKETPLILGMDEAHNFLTDADSVQARQVIGKFSEAAKQGRKERLGLFLITQDPQDIADPVFKQVNTTIVLNLGDEDAIKSVNIPSSLEGKVPYFEKGQMAVYSPDNSDPVEIVGLSTCLTRHG